MEFILPVTVVVIIVLALRYGVKYTTILEYQRGLKYNKGKFESVLEPGQYWHIPFHTIIHKVDIRPMFISITGQEVLSSDGVTLRVSMAANYEITNPETAINKVQSYYNTLYLELQLALREIIGATDIDTVLDSRDELSKKLIEMIEPKASDIGLKLISVSIKDIMFPGKLKEIFAQVVNAKKEGLAALEKARGETAALRNLTNAAKLIEDNPNLLQLRMLQTLGESSGNTLVLGVSGDSKVVPVSKGKSKDKE